MFLVFHHNIIINVVDHFQRLEKLKYVCSQCTNVQPQLVRTLMMMFNIQT